MAAGHQHPHVHQFAGDDSRMKRILIVSLVLTLAFVVFEAAAGFSGLVQVMARFYPKRRRISPPPPGRSFGSAYQFFVMRMPNRRGSVVKTLVVSAVSSEFRNAPVIAVVLKAFFR